MLVSALFLATFAAAAAGHGNPGFEDGVFGPWGVGVPADSAEVVGPNGFESPYEGLYMARLGTPPDSPEDCSESEQPIGSNAAGQAFTISESSLTFAWSLHTCDYEDYDSFSWTLFVDGSPVAGEMFDAWGPSGDTSYKTTGWSEVSVDTSAYIGEDAFFVVDCSGTSDESYTSWCYVDAVPVPAPPVTPRFDLSFQAVDANGNPLNGATGWCGYPDGEGNFNDSQPDTPVFTAVDGFGREGMGLCTFNEKAAYAVKVQYDPDGDGPEFHEAISAEVTGSGFVVVVLPDLDLG